MRKLIKDIILIGLIIGINSCKSTRIKQYIVQIIFLHLLLAPVLYSCQEKPTFCEKPYKVDQIRLIPTGTFRKGKEVVIKNDSLINVITNQICNIKDVSWSTGNRGDGKSVEIQFLPKNNINIYVVKRGLDYNDYRFREGTTYFKNDVLCELVFKLTEINDNNNSSILTIE